MKKFFFKLKKLLNPTTAVCAAAGLVTIVLYLLFGNPSTKGESALFLFSIFLCLTVLGVIAVHFFGQIYRRKLCGEGIRPDLCPADQH